MESAKEEDLLTAIKRMAVLVSNPMVHRNQMRDHRQGESEKVRGFVVRVREAAVDCKFKVMYSAASCEFRWFRTRRKSSRTGVCLA